MQTLKHPLHMLDARQLGRAISSERSRGIRLRNRSAIRQYVVALRELQILAAGALPIGWKDTRQSLLKLRADYKRAMLNGFDCDTAATRRYYVDVITHIDGHLSAFI